jgi:hypothetical protein
MVTSLYDTDHGSSGDPMASVNLVELTAEAEDLQQDSAVGVLEALTSQPRNGVAKNAFSGARMAFAKFHNCCCLLFRSDSTFSSGCRRARHAQISARSAARPLAASHAQTIIVGSRLSSP